MLDFKINHAEINTNLKSFIDTDPRKSLRISSSTQDQYER